MKATQSTTSTSAVPNGLHAANADTVPVTVDNFVRAESDRYIGGVLQDAGGLGKFHHFRQPADVAHQTVIRLNRDTLYSGIVVDLDAGPATLTLPDAGKRFMSVQIISQDHYTAGATYGAGPRQLTRENVGTRYAVAAIRTLVDPSDPKDIDAVHALQDAITLQQPGGPGKWEVPKWDATTQGEVRNALLSLGAQLPDATHMFGTRENVDPIHHLIGSATAWGGNIEKDALYLNSTPPRNDGKTAYVLHVKDVPVDGFWSVSVYNAEGYYTPNALNAYSLNNLTAKPDADGGITVRFGGNDPKAPNFLPIEPGWNYLVRLYRPRAEILDGSWKFPEAQPVQ